MRREKLEPGAIVARFAQSWLRIGTFDLLRARGERALVRQLAGYVATDVFGGWETLPRKLAAGEPDATAHDVASGVAEATTEGNGLEAENRYTRLYREIVRRNATTVAAWQAYGFMNGVLNTDNTSLYGLSIDFGPFAFMDDFDPSYTPNHDDGLLRYAYRNQPTIIWWNLVRLGESLGELMGAGGGVDAEAFVEKGVRQEDADELVARAEAIIARAGEEYKSVFLAEYKRLMSARLGLRTRETSDFDTLFSELLDTMEALSLDFNLFFRRLSSVRIAEVETETQRREVAARFFHAEGVRGDDSSARTRVANWLAAWRARVLADWGADGCAAREAAMKEMNPNVSSHVPTPPILYPLFVPIESDADSEMRRAVRPALVDPRRADPARRAQGRARRPRQGHAHGPAPRSATPGAATPTRSAGSVATCPA